MYHFAQDGFVQHEGIQQYGSDGKRPGA